MYPMKIIAPAFGLLLLAFATTTLAEQLPPTLTRDGAASPGLRDAVVVIIRHAEKPESGFELSVPGQQRADAYVNYFKTLNINSHLFKPDCLYATADSKGSHRPRLTLEPLGKALGLKIDAQYKNKDFVNLASEIRSHPPGKSILIAWHHGEIPALAQALGADPAKLLPDGKWPSEVFGWMLELSYDHAGRLMPEKTKRINENLMSADSRQ